MMTQRQLSEELQLSAVTLWKLRCAGMPYMAIGSRTVRYNLPEVMEWLQGRKRAVEPSKPSQGKGGDNNA